ncbi:MAG: hypothetical protein HZC23_15890 [Rhodocyclales bacterium]|nr:hypothetical protein [Rhodocyclales bacterium]
MLVFLDTEFTDFIDLRLISVGLAAEDGRTCYGELARDCWLEAVSGFVRANVAPLLDQSRPGGEGERPEALAERLRDWLAGLGEVQLASDNLAHDFDLLVDLFAETGTAWPTNVAKTPLRVDCYLRGEALAPAVMGTYQDFFTESGLVQHHALNDALALRAMWLEWHE